MPGRDTQLDPQIYFHAEPVRRDEVSEEFVGNLDRFGASTRVKDTVRGVRQVKSKRAGKLANGRVGTARSIKRSRRARS